MNLKCNKSWKQSSSNRIFLSNVNHMVRNTFVFAFIFLLSIYGINAQVLKPGYDKNELLEVFLVSARTGGRINFNVDSNYLAPPQHHKLAYRSPEMGLKSLWELWISDQHSAIITIRGTTGSLESWLNNFYAAMIPAKGKLSLPGNDTVEYQVASDPKAAVHVGWMFATLILSQDILPRIDSCYKVGIKDFIITGHSQGGGISYLMTAYFLDLKSKGRIPSDVQFKTYCTAAPKPGNLYFAYDYELATQGGWAFNIVNTTDWVPEVPFSIQTIHDFNDINAFQDADKIIKKQKFPKRQAFRYIYNQLSKPGLKAQRKYEKYLGNMMGKQYAKKLPGIGVEAYYPSNNYVRTGVTILLHPTEEYFTRYNAKSGNVFVNHFHRPYIYLLDQKALIPPTR